MKETGHPCISRRKGRFLAFTDITHSTVWVWSSELLVVGTRSPISVHLPSHLTAVYVDLLLQPTYVSEWVYILSEWVYIFHTNWIKKAYDFFEWWQNTMKFYPSNFIKRKKAIKLWSPCSVFFQMLSWLSKYIC